MACCDSFSRKRKSSSDVEIEDTFLKEKEALINIKDKPLSPVLSGGLNNRKFLIGKRLSHKKSTRVKLSDRFEKNDKKYLVVNPIVSIPEYLDDTLSVTQSETLVDHLEKLEELDRNRKDLYKVLTRDNKKSDKFKKPTFIPVKNVKSKNSIGNITNANVDNAYNFQKNLLNNEIPIYSDKLSVGFRTARERNISVSESDIKKHSKLFEDILNPTQCISEGRYNKHAFLKKNSVTLHDFEANTNSLSNTDVKCMKFFKEEKSVQLENIRISFSTASGSKITTSNKTVTNFFTGEDFSDIENNDERNSCCEKENHKLVKVTPKKIGNTNEHDELSLTQAICESGISNTQILHAIDNILYAGEVNKKYDFNGFSKHDVTESYTKLHNQEKALTYVEHSVSIYVKFKEKYISSNKQMFQIKKEYPFCKKHRIEDFSLHSAKHPRTSLVLGFHSASGKSIETSQKSLKKANMMFTELNIDISKEKNILPIINKVILNDKNVENQFYKKPKSISCTEYMENKTDNSQEKNLNLSHMSHNFIKNNSTIGFSKASGKAIKISESSLQKAKNMFGQISENPNFIHERTLDEVQNQSPRLNSTTSQRDSTKIHSRMQQNDILTGQNVSKSAIERSLGIQQEPITVQNTDKCNGSFLNAKNIKKKLGVSHCKPINICDQKLDKAKLLFNEDFSEISPIKPRRSTTYTSTPIRQNTYLTPARNNCQRPSKSFSDFVDAADITPIKVDVENPQEKILCNTNLKILYTSPTKCDWMDDLEREKKKLECRLQIILQRQKLGQKALECLHTGKTDYDKKPRKGILYQSKLKENRIPLPVFVGNKKSGFVRKNIEVAINPKNAENVHFTGQLTACIITEDGAQVIPNSKDMIGLSEIKNAFEVMPGVEPRLLPKGWIRNHFKWIVWKLASYQNMFPCQFEECLNIENIVQQLKYRYDREIDRAERSALRKIYEKDDAPQKRMVLCVSDIKLVDIKKYELELCDGWYAIRTIIDEPLCNQIINGKVTIGTKLIISGAELLNCDGCYPLEATNLVCLKINCNSTRRAVWHAKLGFQRYPNPFLVSLQSIIPLGGTVAAVKVCVVRVYPLKYMEKLEGHTVWRNRKAEETQAQKWENENKKKIEQIQDEARKKFENSCFKQTIEKRSNLDISSVRCPKELYAILEGSNDPEYLQESLSCSQKEAVLLYQSNLSIKKQEEITTEVNKSLTKLKLAKRDVTAVLQLLVIDSNTDSDTFNLTIWRPTEAHLQSIREGMTFTIQNVMPRLNGGLSSNMKTTFKTEPITTNICSKYKRRLTSFTELFESNSLSDFKEFDTVGIVVQIKIESIKQEVWITDNIGRLLYIKIYEGPDTCLLLDTLKRGQTTTICNLMYCSLMKDVIQATANHFTVFSSYSQHKHLREGLDLLKKEIVKDLPSLLNDCDNKIEIFKIISDIKSSFSENFEDTDEFTLLPITSPHV